MAFLYSRNSINQGIENRMKITIFSSKPKTKNPMITTLLSIFGVCIILSLTLSVFAFGITEKEYLCIIKNEYLVHRALIIIFLLTGISWSLVVGCATHTLFHKVADLIRMI